MPEPQLVPCCAASVLELSSLILSTQSPLPPQQHPAHGTSRDGQPPLWRLEARADGDRADQARAEGKKDNDKEQCVVEASVEWLKAFSDLVGDCSDADDQHVTWTMDD